MSVTIDLAIFTLNLVVDDPIPRELPDVPGEVRITRAVITWRARSRGWLRTSLRVGGPRIKKDGTDSLTGVDWPLFGEDCRPQWVQDIIRAAEEARDERLAVVHQAELALRDARVAEEGL